MPKMVELLFGGCFLFILGLHLKFLLKSELPNFSKSDNYKLS